MAVEPPLSTRGRYIVDAHGRRVRLAGVNWYGAHEDLGVAPGLDQTDRRALARRIASHGFNSVRLPFSLWMTEQTAPVPAEYLAANPDLTDAAPMQVYDACVEALTEAGLIVIPNEPRRTRVGWRVLTPTWGSRPRTDIAAMYTAVGNLIHQVSPDVLIICEGLEYAADLSGAASRPVRLERPGKVVDSLHDYPWFHPGEQPRSAYLEQMERTGGYLLSQQLAPVWIGEFGSATGSMAAFSGVWWNNFAAWVTGYDVDWCWWALNPTQPKGTVPVTGRHRSRWGDPEPWGLLTADWRGVANPAVLDILKDLIPARTGPGVVP